MIAPSCKKKQNSSLKFENICELVARKRLKLFPSKMAIIKQSQPNLFLFWRPRNNAMQIFQSGKYNKHDFWANKPILNTTISSLVSRLPFLFGRFQFNQILKCFS